jgi:hypothetical protein
LKTIKAYKGFNKDLTCQKFQHEIGKEYQHDGDVICCRKGFHACINPIDVLHYYVQATFRYCIVYASGKISEYGSKISSSKIKICEERNTKSII